MAETVERQEGTLRPRGRVALLIGIMSAVVITVEIATIAILYHTALAEERARLTELAESQARVIEAIARFDRAYSRSYPDGPGEATLQQLRDAHSRYSGFGKTGEFTLARRQGDDIVFLLNHRHHDLTNPHPVPWDSPLAAPMRAALSGKSGMVVDLDYRGEIVLAAHEPVGELDLGIVAKIDMSEIRAPFVNAALLSLAIAILVIALGAAIFFKVTNPLLRRLHRTVSELQTALGEVRTLRGILPICSFCKRIRDDRGYWDQVEVYVREHSEADFSHGICPDCMAKHYDELMESTDDETAN